LIWGRWFCAEVNKAFYRACRQLPLGHFEGCKMQGRTKLISICIEGVTLVQVSAVRDKILYRLEFFVCHCFKNRWLARTCAVHLGPVR